jgi:putative membrane protein
LKKLFIRWLIAALALFLASWIVPGIHTEGSGWIAFALVAIILGLINALIRPILKVLSFPLIIVTLGLFTLVINALMLWLASSIAVNWFDVGFYIDGFWSAFFGALIVSIVTVILSAILDRKERGKKD